MLISDYGSGWAARNLPSGPHQRIFSLEWFSMVSPLNDFHSTRSYCKSLAFHSFKWIEEMTAHCQSTYLWARSSRKRHWSLADLAVDYIGISRRHMVISGFAMSFLILKEDFVAGVKEWLRRCYLSFETLTSSGAECWSKAGATRCSSAPLSASEALGVRVSDWGRGGEGWTEGSPATSVSMSHERQTSSQSLNALQLEYYSIRSHSWWTFALCFERSMAL